AHEADSCPTPEKCATQLRILVTDPVRNWVGQPQSADAYANGTRLFAYRALKKKLSCDELRRALVETETAGPSLQGPRYEAARKWRGDGRRKGGAERTGLYKKAKIDGPGSGWRLRQSHRHSPSPCSGKQRRLRRHRLVFRRGTRIPPITLSRPHGMISE